MSSTIASSSRSGAEAGAGADRSRVAQMRSTTAANPLSAGFASPDPTTGSALGVESALSVEGVEVEVSSGRQGVEGVGAPPSFAGGVANVGIEGVFEIVAMLDAPVHRARRLL
jgi:hypothetical protein